MTKSKTCGPVRPLAHSYKIRTGARRDQKEEQTTMNTRNIITAVALVTLLVTTLTLSAPYALAQATQTRVVKSTEGQSETEPSVATDVQSAPDTVASAVFTDRSTPLQGQKFKFVSKRPPLSSFRRC